MPIFLDTSGLPHLGIAVCSRCGIKFPIDELREDPNYPGLRVCSYDIDVLDPYRLAPRETEDITLAWPRPDLHLPPGPASVWANQVSPGIGLNQPGVDVIGAGETLTK